MSNYDMQFIFLKTWNNKTNYDAIIATVELIKLRESSTSS